MIINDAKEKLKAKDLMIISFINWRTQTLMRAANMMMNKLRTLKKVTLFNCEIEKCAHLNWPGRETMTEWIRPFKLKNKTIEK